MAPAVKNKNTKRTAGNLAFTGSPTELLLVSDSTSVVSEELISANTRQRTFSARLMILLFLVFSKIQRVEP